MESRQLNSAEKKNRPVLIWFAVLFYFTTALLPVLSVMVNDTARNQFLSQSDWQYLMALAVPALNIIGAFLLFQLRKYAFHVLSVALVIDILKTLYLFAFTRFMEQTAKPIWVVLQIAVFWTICVMIIMYARFLIKKNILQ